MRASKEPRSVPNPAYGQEAAECHRTPTAVLVKISTSNGGKCACCERYMNEGDCAVGLYVRTYDGRNVRHFAFADEILCPWCAELPEAEVNRHLVRSIGAQLKEARATFAECAEDEDIVHAVAMSGLESQIERARLFATAVSDLILKPGEQWTPTSHPRKPMSEEKKAAMKARTDEWARTAFVTIDGEVVKPVPSASAL